MRIPATIGQLANLIGLVGWSERDQDVTSVQPKNSETGPMYQYRVIPAPTKGQKAKGVKTAEDRFAFAMSELLNEMAAEGWEYQRAETLPSEERKGLTGKTTTFRNILVFRRSRRWDNLGEDLANTDDEQPAVAIEEEAPSTAPALPSASQANEVPEEVKAAPAVSEGETDERT